MDMAIDGSVGPLPLRASSLSGAPGRELNGRATGRPASQANGQSGIQASAPARAPSSGPVASSGNPSGTPGGASGGAVLARLVLQVRAGSGQAPQQVAMDGRDITIGRAPGCDVVLPDDPLASRRHSLLRYDGQRYTIADLGSSNGTYVNDLEIHEVTPLGPGDHITVGEHEFLYLLGASATAPGGEDRYNTDGFELRTPPSFSTAAPMLSAQPAPADPPRLPVATVKAPAVSASRAPVPATPDVVPDDAAADAAPADAAPADAAPAVSPTSANLGASAAAPAVDPVERDLEDLRARLVEVSNALTRRSAGAEQVVRHLREIMAELRGRVDRALANPSASIIAPNTKPGEETASHMDELLGVVRAAAENPRHLDHLTALSGHADDLAATLEAQQQRIGALESTRAEMTAALEELRARLAGLVEEERQAAGDGGAQS
ncbi:MAG TPA: FHA domain-containing protein [Ktedonobacterales bacterium]